VYTVERILKHRGSPGKYEYQVLWKGYPLEEATWVAQKDFLDTECIRSYWRAKEDAAQTTDRTSRASTSSRNRKRKS
jgi:Chromo (CHRromatin Organisation MOdifier) domain